MPKGFSTYSVRLQEYTVRRSSRSLKRKERTTRRPAPYRLSPLPSRSEAGENRLYRSPRGSAAVISGEGQHGVRAKLLVFVLERPPRLVEKVISLFDVGSPISSRRCRCAIPSREELPEAVLLLRFEAAVFAFTASLPQRRFRRLWWVVFWWGLNVSVSPSRMNRTTGKTAPIRAQ